MHPSLRCSVDGRLGCYRYKHKLLVSVHCFLTVSLPLLSLLVPGPSIHLSTPLVQDSLRQSFKWLLKIKYMCATHPQTHTHVWVRACLSVCVKLWVHTVPKVTRISICHSINLDLVYITTHWPVYFSFSYKNTLRHSLPHYSVFRLSTTIWYSWCHTLPTGSVPCSLLGLPLCV